MHKVVILDSSGSMNGAKYNSAKKGIELDYEACKKDGFADYELVEFSTSMCTKLYRFNEELKFNPEFSNTALYSTIYAILTNVLNTIPTEDKVLIQIFTDGQDNSSYGYKPVARKAIEDCNAKGWTVTFLGTKEDVAFVQRNLSIADSNTLVHENTAESIEFSFTTYMDSQSTYTKNVAKGEDVTRGFFKNTKND